MGIHNMHHTKILQTRPTPASANLSLYYKQNKQSENTHHEDSQEM